MHKLTGQASKGIGPEKVVADIAGAGGRAVRGLRTWTGFFAQAKSTFGTVGIW